MRSTKFAAGAFCLMALCALWIALHKPEPGVEQKEEMQPVVSLESAYRLWSEDAMWEGISWNLFDSVHRSGFQELKQAIARDPNAALTFYQGIPVQDRTGFAIAAAEAVGIDIYAKAKEVGFDEIGIHLLRDFSEHIRHTKEQPAPLKSGVVRGL